MTKLQKLAKQVQKLLDTTKATDQERVDFFAQIRSEWCVECGRPIAKGERCHCNNDE